MARRKGERQPTSLAERLKVQGAEKAIFKMMKKGQLFSEDQVSQLIDDNSNFMYKVMIIAISRSLGVGEKRVRERVLPAFEEVINNYEKNSTEVDKDYAESKISQEYAAITGRCVNQIKMP